MRILIVESDPDVARSLAELVGAMGHDPCLASDAATARRVEGHVDVVLLDRTTAGREVRGLAKDLDAPVVLLTTDAETVELTPPRGVVAVLAKPFRVHALESALAKAASARGRATDAASSEMASG